PVIPLRRRIAVVVGIDTVGDTIAVGVVQIAANVTVIAIGDAVAIPIQRNHYAAAVAIVGVLLIAAAIVVRIPLVRNTVAIHVRVGVCRTVGVVVRSLCRGRTGH